MSGEQSLSPEVPGKILGTSSEQGPKVPGKLTRFSQKRKSRYEDALTQVVGAAIRSEKKQVESRIVSSETEPELEIHPSEVTGYLLKCCEFDNQINLLNDAYQMVYGVSTNLLDFSNLTKIETPMKNTVLHIAAWYGNNDIVNLVIQHAPKLLFKFNKNNDSALHVAARGGHIQTVKKLLACYANIERHDVKMAWFKYIHLSASYTIDQLSWQCYDENEEWLENIINNDQLSWQCYDEKANMANLLEFVKMKNVQGNTMLHEAMLCRDIKRIGGDKIFTVCELYITEDRFRKSLSKCCYEFALDIVNQAKKSVLYLAVENGDKDAVKRILENSPKNDAKPEGLSPVVAAIMKHNQEMLSTILENIPTWIHLRDTHGRLPLHYAASIGYLQGVDFLLDKCKCCTIHRDEYGYFPIHLASYGGHVEVVKKLLEYCPDPTEMLDTSHERNILHIASNYGKHEVVQYILQSQSNEHHKMINQRDNKGDTPLHLAARSCHPRTVYYLVNQSKERVKLDLVNQNNETALDIVSALFELDKSSLRQLLTWTALKSAGAKQSPRRVLALHIESKPSETKHSNEKSTKTEEKQSNKEKEKVSERYKDRIENLTIVSTLIITASVAACLAVPGEADGKANNLYHAMFQAFIIFITISLFSSITATILLFWATFGIIELVTFTLKIVMPLLGIALISLSLAFMAGLYTVISELSWLANVLLVMTLIFVVVVILLYMLLSLPSPSTRKPLRYISHYPYLFLASRTESKPDQSLHQNKAKLHQKKNT